MVHIPYSGGGAAALTDVLSGSVPLLIDIAFGVMPRVEQKQMKVIAVTGPKRSSFFPDIPAISENDPWIRRLELSGCVRLIPNSPGGFGAHQQRTSGLGR